MTTSDHDQSQPHGGEHGTGTAAAPQQQADSGGSERGGQSQRHGRGRRRSGGGGGARPEQQQRRPEGQPSSRRHESGLNMDELRELTELFSSHGLTDFEFENADIRIRLARNPAPVAAAAPAPPAAPGPLAAMQSGQGASHAASPQPTTPAPQPPPPAAPEPPEEELHIIIAEMVGTFYRASSPTSEPFVKVGSQVEPGTVVCIIEAMKLMNEIEADAAGAIAKIYVENGQPVEYGQPLFGVKK